MASPPPVVAGVDGSSQSLQAARWAAMEAHRRHTPLHLVIVNDDPTRVDYARKAVRDAAKQCRTQVSTLDVIDEVVPGHPVDELLRRAQQAQLVVVGSRGHGAFTDALLGSVSAGVATQAHCPAVVVRDEGTSTGPVVVGVDDSTGSRAALGFAFQQAATRGAELVAVQVWHEEGLLSGPLPPEDRDQIQHQVEPGPADDRLGHPVSRCRNPQPRLPSASRRRTHRCRSRRTTTGGRPPRAWRIHRPLPRLGRLRSSAPRPVRGRCGANTAGRTQLDRQRRTLSPCGQGEPATPVGGWNAY